MTWLCALCWQGLEIVFRVGLAILQMNQAELMQLDMEGMLQVSEPGAFRQPVLPREAGMRMTPLCPCRQHFQKVVPHQLDSGPDRVILTAYQVKYNAKKMKKYVHPLRG